MIAATVALGFHRFVMAGLSVNADLRFGHASLVRLRWIKEWAGRQEKPVKTDVSSSGS
jgi:hypothetical protein